MSRRNRKLPWTSVKGSRRFARRPWKWAEDSAPHRVKLARQIEAEPLVDPKGERSA